MKKINAVVLATTNLRKIEEYSKYLEEYVDCPILTLKDFPDVSFDNIEETGETYLENAKIKAEALYNQIHDKDRYLILADDSGIEIDALKGELGVHTARFISEDTSYPEKVNHILEQMKSLQVREGRVASLVSTIYAIFPNGHSTYAEGKITGFIGKEKYGEDPLGFESIFHVYAYEEQMSIYGDVGKVRLNPRKGFFSLNEIKEKKYCTDNESSRKNALKYLNHYINIYELYEFSCSTLFEELIALNKINSIFGFNIDENKSLYDDSDNIIKVYFNLPESYSEDIVDLQHITINDLIENFKITCKLTSIIGDHKGYMIDPYKPYNSDVENIINDPLFDSVFKFYMKRRKGETWTLEDFYRKSDEYDAILEKLLDKIKNTINEKNEYEEV